MTDAATTEAKTAVSSTETTNGNAESTNTSDQDLEALLAEFDANTTKAVQQISSQQTTAKREDVDMSTVVQRLHRLESKEADSEVNALVQKLKSSDDLQGVSERLIRNYIEGEALRNQKLALAYANRHNDPKAWTNVERSLAKTIANDLPKRDAVAAKVQSDRAAMVDATKTATLGETKAETPNFATMSSAEFREYERKLGITV